MTTLFLPHLSRAMLWLISSSSHVWEQSFHNTIYHHNMTSFQFPYHSHNMISSSYNISSYRQKQGLRAQSHMRRIIFLSLLKGTCDAWATRHHLLISITLTFSRSTTCCLMYISLTLTRVES